MKQIRWSMFTMLVLLGLMVAAGCRVIQNDPKAQLFAAQKSFSSVVRGLASLKAAKLFSNEEVAIVSAGIHQVGDYLKEWEAAVLAGEARPHIARAVFRALDELIALKTQVQERAP